MTSASLLTTKKSSSEVFPGWVGTKKELTALLDLLQRRINEKRGEWVAERTAWSRGALEKDRQDIDKRRKRDADESDFRVQMGREPLPEGDSEYVQQAIARAATSEAQLAEDEQKAEFAFVLRMAVTYSDGDTEEFRGSPSELADVAAGNRIKRITVHGPGGYGPKISTIVTMAKSGGANISVAGNDAPWVHDTINALKGKMRENIPWWLQVLGSKWFLRATILIVAVPVLAAVVWPLASQLEFGSLFTLCIIAGLWIAFVSWALVTLFERTVPIFEVVYEGNKVTGLRPLISGVAYVLAIVIPFVLDPLIRGVNTQ